VNAVSNNLCAALRQAYFVGARTALEALAMRADEHGEMLDFAGLLYDEACDTLNALRGGDDASLWTSDDRPGIED
jgi:hypothetical protein